MHAFLPIAFHNSIVSSKEIMCLSTMSTSSLSHGSRNLKKQIYKLFTRKLFFCEQERGQRIWKEQSVERRRRLKTAVEKERKLTELVQINSLNYTCRLLSHLWRKLISMYLLLNPFSLSWTRGRKVSTTKVLPGKVSYSFYLHNESYKSRPSTHTN